MKTFKVVYDTHTGPVTELVEAETYNVGPSVLTFYKNSEREYNSTRGARINNPKLVIAFSSWIFFAPVTD